MRGGNGYEKASEYLDEWDFAMGYMHGLAGAQRRYYNGSDDYKASWNLANNAMRTLVGAAEKVAVTPLAVRLGGWLQ
jgi:hypothetical protein